jgi:membrane-bound inhibitor of C-type lysozyme
MQPARSVRRLRSAFVVAFAMMAGLLAACANSPGKDEQEAAANTFACQVGGERLVVKFQVDEVWLLMPDGDRVILYRVPSGAGVRFTNGTYDLRGKGADLQMVRNGAPMALVGCQPYLSPK